MTYSLRERQEMFESASDFLLLWRVPVVIRVNLKNYLKLIDNLDQLYCLDFANLISQTMLYIITNIPDAILGYCHHDEMTIILRNDMDKDTVPWHGNKIQPIISVAASLATLGFHQSRTLFAKDLDLKGNAIFNVKVFTLPSLPEAVNNLVLRQSYCMGTALDDAAYSVLDEKFGQAHADKLLENASYEDKKKLLLQHARIDFVEHYPTSFYRGMAIYKEPTIVYSHNTQETKNKWVVNDNLPNFVKDKDFLLNILRTGTDIFRGRTLLPKLDK